MRRSVVLLLIVAANAPRLLHADAAPVDQSKSEAFRAATVPAQLAKATADAERKKKLTSGEVLLDTFAVPGFETAAVVVQGVVDATPEVTWTVIESCTQYKNYMPRIIESDELSRVDGVIRCRTKLDSPWPVDDLVGTTLARHTVGEGRWLREWRMESGDYKYIVGSWTLVPFDGDPKRTLAIYFVHSEPKGGVPGPLREFAQRTALPDVIRSLRKEAERRAK